MILVKTADNKNKGHLLHSKALLCLIRNAPRGPKINLMVHITITEICSDKNYIYHCDFCQI